MNEDFHQKRIELFLKHDIENSLLSIDAYCQYKAWHLNDLIEELENNND